ncbi:polyketide synthase [Streptomyces sp. NPDC029080]|uniref:polyketide synthase n=1 Tax=Streptomyces sp. NPDC029080 TaxID=3155017 RepID=UPI0033CB6606
MTAFTVTAVGSVSSGRPAELAHNRPSFFADPVAWLVTAAVDRALRASADDLTAAPDRVGVITLSGTCSALTMTALADSARRGRISPLRFAGAHPGVLAGLTCIRRKFRGPTLALAMDPVHGLDPAAAVTAAWLGGGQASHVLLAVHLTRDGIHTARCAVVRPAPRPADGRAELDQLLVPDPGEGSRAE